MQAGATTPWGPKSRAGKHHSFPSQCLWQASPIDHSTLSWWAWEPPLNPSPSSTKDETYLSSQVQVILYKLAPYIWIPGIRRVRHPNDGGGFFFSHGCGGWTFSHWITFLKPTSGPSEPPVLNFKCNKAPDLPAWFLASVLHAWARNPA